MKRKAPKILLAALVLTLTLAMLISCNDSPSNNGSPTGTSGSEKATYHIILDGNAEFTIIRPEKIDRELFDRILQLRKCFKEKHDVSINSFSDQDTNNSESGTVESDSNVHEILIGSTNRAESRLTAEEYEDLYGFVIRVVNGKIVIWGSDLLQTVEAIQYFEESFLQTDTPAIDEGFCFVSDLGDSGSVSSVLANDFTVIYPAPRQNRDLDSVGIVNNQLLAITGKRPSVHSDEEAPKGKEILIGSTNRETSIAIDKALGYMDYCVKVTSDYVILIGGSPLATENAVNHFNHAILTRKITSLEQGYEFYFDFDPYLKNSMMNSAEAFVPVWAKDFTVPDWLTNFDEKLYAMTAPTGRMTADAHRGDTVHYPENSLPAILSAILLGADVIEIDVRLTKDNVMVLMHDESLKRTTNWSQMQGKDGLPTSDKIQDWTYEQLQMLNLKHNDTVTSYKIPTAYEAVSLFDGRTQIHFDCKINTVDKYTDVYLLAEELGVKECFIYYYGIDTMKEWVSFDPDDIAFRETVEKVEGYLSFPNHGLRKRKYELVEQYGDSSSGWIKQYDAGYRMVFTDRIYDLCRYIAENQAAMSP